MRQITTTTVVWPANDRDYKTAAEAESDFKAGVEFDLESAQSVTVHDFAAGTFVHIHFDHGMETVVVKVPLPSIPLNGTDTKAIRTRQHRAIREQVLKDMGLSKVKGAVSRKTYWE